MFIDLQKKKNFIITHRVLVITLSLLEGYKQDSPPIHFRTPLELVSSLSTKQVSFHQIPIKVEFIRRSISHAQRTMKDIEVKRCLLSAHPIRNILLCYWRYHSKPQTHSFYFFFFFKFLDSFIISIFSIFGLHMKKFCDYQIKVQVLGEVIFICNCMLSMIHLTGQNASYPFKSFLDCLYP